MAKEVIKKDGTKQPFDSRKIRNSIAAAAARTELSDERKEEVAEQVSNTIVKMVEGRDEVATSELRDKILDELDNVEPSVAEDWRKYDAEKKGS